MAQKEIDKHPENTGMKVAQSKDVSGILNEFTRIVGSEWKNQLPVFLGPSQIARILWFDFLVRKTVEIPGIVVEFGSHYGASFSTLNNLFQIHDSWNRGRRIISFSNFEDGFQDVDSKDGVSVELGGYATSKGWDTSLEIILDGNSNNSPSGVKPSLIKGDACLTFERFLEEEPGVLLSLAHFDMDIYKPTKTVLEKCLSRMPKGGIIVFDELNHPGFPGETIALNEVLGIKNVKLRKSPFQSYSAYLVIE